MRTLTLLLLVPTITLAGPPSFRQDVIPALTVAGCNQGACHGAAQGRDGFRLSLRGCDPADDYTAITREARGRRIDLQNPDNSLLLTRGLGKAAQNGCRGFVVGDPSTEIVRAWLAARCPDDANPVALHHLEVTPSARRLVAPTKGQQLTARAVFVNDTSRDVTGLTLFSTSDSEIATVDRTGRVVFQKPGAVAILGRYLHGQHVVRLAYHEPKPGFVWEAPPEVNFIDKHVFAKLKELELPPAELCSDAVFLRRVALDLCALQPTPDLLRAFSEDNDPRKRAKLVEQLLDRGDHADFWALKWLDALRSSRNALQLEGANAYRLWWRGHVRANTPFDAVVRELLTATGHAYEAGAVNYFRVTRTPDDLAEITGQVFLGTRIGCARCHDHQHDRWTRADFRDFAGFFAGLKFTPAPRAPKQSRGEVLGLVPTEQAARYPGGAVATFAPGQDRRAALAEWLTAKETPYFARATVNRVWTHLLGRGIVDPVDDLRDANPPANEALLNALADDFVRHRYDVRHLLRTILASRTYQLASTPHPPSKDDTRNFARTYPRMLSPEQLIDAISAITEVADKYPDLPAGTRAIQVPDPWTSNAFLKTFGRPARELACECADQRGPNLASTLHLMNSDAIQKKLQEPRNRIGRLLDRKATDQEIVEDLFLAVLGRLPKAEERVQIVNHLTKGGMSRRQALEDILWAILNTKEFLFRQ